jgi:hypothetical protein
MSQTRPPYGQPDESYKTLNVGAHRKPAPLCGAPSLTWHRAFWKNQENADDWHRNIDAFLLGIFKECFEIIRRAQPSYFRDIADFLKPDPSSPSPDLFDCPNVDKSEEKIYFFRNSHNLNEENCVLHKLGEEERFLRYDIFSLQFNFCGASLSIRAELFHEFWTLTCILDFGVVFPHVWSEGEPETSLEKITYATPGNRTIIAIAETIDHVQSLITKRYSGHRDKNIAVDLTEEESGKLARVRTDLVDQFHNLCDEEIFKSANSCALSIVGDSYLFPCDRKIAEFCGNVFGLQIKNSAVIPISTALIAPVKESAPSKKKRLTIHSLIGDSSYSPTDAHRLIDAAWPFIHELHLIHPDNSINLLERKPEFSGSLFQNRRSLYISSLGRLNPNANYTMGKTEPVIYTIFVCNRSRWQIGRIVERMHNLGVCRVAALWNLGRITDAGNQLYDLRMKLDSQTGDRLPPISPADAAKEIAAIQASVPDGGLSYRVERTSYYVKQINNLLPTLRICRIEGFQPYDQFIRRRLYGTFDFIERMGVVYADLRSEITLQLDRQRTQQFMLLADTIKTNTTAITVFTEHTAKRQKTTNLLLDNAEFLIALPVFYYFGQIISYIIEDLKTLGNLNISGGSEFFPFILSGTITFLLVRYFRRRHDDAKESRRQE